MNHSISLAPSLFLMLNITGQNDCFYISSSVFQLIILWKSKKNNLRKGEKKQIISNKKNANINTTTTTTPNNNAIKNKENTYHYEKSHTTQNLVSSNYFFRQIVYTVERITLMASKSKHLSPNIIISSSKP